MSFPLDSFDGPQLDTKKALLLLDFQNDFVSSEGRLVASSATSFLPKISELVARFREKGEVVWTQTQYRDPAPTISPETGAYCVLLKQFVRELSNVDDNASGYATPRTDCEGSQAYSEPPIEPDMEAFLASDLPPGSDRCCVPGSWGCEFPDTIVSAINRERDIIVVKSQYSAFADMSLLFQLRTRMVTNLYVCGSLSNISIYATVLDAVRHGFSVTLIEDCLGFRDEDCHYEAVRQMADSMCADGIDFQELMDDLAGMLGDVIREDDYTTRFQVDISRPQPTSYPHTNEQHVNDWITIVESSNHRPVTIVEAKGPDSNVRPVTSESDHADDSSLIRPITQRSCTIDSSPPRKRSTEDIEELEEAPSNKLLHKEFTRYASLEPSSPQSDTLDKKNRHPTRRVKKDKFDQSTRNQSPSLMQAYSTGDISDGVSSQGTVDDMPPSSTAINSKSCINKKKPNKKVSSTFVGPHDPIGDGTSKIVHDVIDDAFADQAFEILRTNVAWQKMYHRTGEVPRLVAVQGDILESSADNSKTVPIYRHPADESPELLPFDPTVDALRQACEQRVGHTLNHVLIQHYRNSEDNISEHSDKSLDIIRGSNIVNLSLGAQRTMILRAKKHDSESASSDHPETSTNVTDQKNKPRETQRVHLPHNSLFILSSSTNAKFLHSIRADKRPAIEKSSEELAFNSERISLTFRHIGTYITTLPDGTQLIWGQGAKGKSRTEANSVLSGDEEAAKQGEAMIIAFGKENHEGVGFDWELNYRRGFDVLNFLVKQSEA